MTNLGLWTPYIDEREMRSWYDLPADMQAECRRYRPNGRELDALSQGAYAQLRQRTITYTDRSVLPYSPAYHYSRHFAQVEAFGLAAADAYAAGNRRRMPLLVRQVFGVTLYAHDAHHCASTFRSEAPRGIYRPDLGVNVTAEWVTALANNTFMKQQGLNLPARLFQTGVTWSSTYGAGTPIGKRLNVPAPTPQTIWGAIMRAADVCPPEKFGDFIGQTCAVNYGEVPAQPASRTLNGFVAQNKAFVGYIETCFNRLDAISGMPLTGQLNWWRRLVNLRRGLAALEAGNRQAVDVLRREMLKYGVTLVV